MDFNGNTSAQLQEEKIVYKAYDNGFEKAAFVLGIISIITAFLGLGTIPMMLGGLAVILAVLSRGKGEMGRKAFRGMICGLAAIGVSVLLVVYVIMLFCTNVTYRNLINAQCKMMYGTTLNELIEESVGDDFNLEQYLSR